MNISYLLSVLDLYLMKEKNSKLIIEVNNQEEIVKINFCYSFDTSNKTFVKINKQLFFDNLKEFLKKVQGNLQLDNEFMNNSKTYSLTFSSQRDLSFVNFTLEEIKLIRSYLENPKENFNLEIENTSNRNNFQSKSISNPNDTYTQKQISNQNKKLSFSMGFSSYMILLISAIWFLDILMISLWIFKVFIK